MEISLALGGGGIKGIAHVGVIAFSHRFLPNAETGEGVDVLLYEPFEQLASLCAKALNGQQLHRRCELFTVHVRRGVSEVLRQAGVPQTEFAREWLRLQPMEQGLQRSPCSFVSVFNGLDQRWKHLLVTVIPLSLRFDLFQDAAKDVATHFEAQTALHGPQHPRHQGCSGIW